MRILVLENALSSARGGQERSLLDVCRGLAARGHEIVLAYVASGDLEPAYRRFAARLIRVHRYSIDRSRPAASLAGFTASLWALRGTRPDVIYANQYLDSLLAGAAGRLLRAPFVCHLRLPPPQPTCTQFRIGMAQAARLIAISRQTRSDWAAAGYDAERIGVVHNGIDGAAFAPRDDRPALRRALNLPDDALVVVYAGRLHPAKGVETLLRAFDAIACARPSARLVIAGAPAEMPGADGQPRDYGAELRHLAYTLGIAHRITWIAHHPDVTALFGAADIVAVPSVWSEPFGRVVVEAMACERLVAASAVGGIPEILSGEFAAWLCRPGDPAALADCIVALAAGAPDPAAARRARRHVLDHFTVDSMVEGVEAVLRSAVGRAEDASVPAVAREAR